MICKGYAEVNNKTLKSYNTNKPTSYIYLDANNLYRHYDAISSNWKDYNLDNYSDDSLIGCFLEFHRDYPDEFHDLHNSFHLAGKKNQK